MTKKGNRRTFHSTRLYFRFLLRYLMWFLLYCILCVLLYTAVEYLAGQHVWEPTDPGYVILIYIRQGVLAWALLGWVILSPILMYRPYKDLERIMNAAATLAEPHEEEILLPDHLNDAETELNRLREHGLYVARAAREAEQRKDDLIVYLAHDLKTPLTSIIGYLQLLQQEPDLSVETRARYTGITLEKAYRLEDLINEFFDIARLNLTHITLEKSTINLTRLLEQMMSEFDPVLADKHMTWQSDLLPDFSYCCDPDKLQRLFDNLFRNAVSYGYPDSVIFVRMRTVEMESIEIYVENRGPTIPREKLEHLFDQFYRLDSSRGTQTGGAGLGLAIAKEIAELHGGSVTAESLEETIRLTVRLPLSEAAEPREGSNG
ncbi:MAG: HAMP domain-containing histidine kinase [Firmicutes bacterium]|nr:HAMP domain-containing histidine kinase [Bacillota bacterium]